MEVDRNDWRRIGGLTEAEAARRLRDQGYNELPGARRRGTLAITADVLHEPMFMLLAAAAAVYFLLGDPAEAAALLVFVLVVVGITVYQERRTTRVLEALRDLSSPRALVIRDGEQRRIPGREVVEGDTLLLREGDRVPADAAVLQEADLRADESLLTGESVPVSKTVWDGARPPQAPGGDNQPFLYSATLIVKGQGMARAVATGARSRVGRIGRALAGMQPEPTPLQRQTRRLVIALAAAGGVLCLLLIAGYGLTRQDWLGAMLAGITFAMAMLPEEFPVILTIFPALGAWRLSRRRVLTRRMPAIEALGSATVLCVDKTGTLTRNRMAVHSLYADGQLFEVPDEEGAGGELPEQFHELLEFAVLASEVDPFDPMEKAMRALGLRYLRNTEHLHEDWRLVQHYGLTPALPAMSHVWRSAHTDEYVVAAKGAPEAIADLCHLGAVEAEALARRVEALSARGLRLMGVAEARYRGEAWPPVQHDFDFRLRGLIALSDPLRPTVPAALRECREAGIRVVMITGDHPGTALAVGREAGFEGSEVITGPELDRLDDAEVRRRLETVTLFARIVPEQKLKIVNALKAGGEVVAMTGDGVNDAPALRAAHIGIAMGERGTDVAREAASLVLLDDDFASIVTAVRLGRRIYDNLRKAMTYILAVHVPIAGLSLLPVIAGWPLVFMPLHIAFLQLIIDPACSVVFEAEPGEPDLMRRPPRRPDEPLFSWKRLALALLQGAGVLALSAMLFRTALAGGAAPAWARAMAFTALVIGNIALIFAGRAGQASIAASLRRSNRSLWWITGAALVSLLLVLYVAPLRRLFQLAPLDGASLAVAAAAGIAAVAAIEALRGVLRSWASRGAPP